MVILTVFSSLMSGVFFGKWLDIPSNALYYNPESKINWTKLRSKLIVMEKY